MNAGKVAVVKLEMSLVVKLEQCRGVGVVLLQVKVVDLRLGGGVAAVLAHVHLNIMISPGLLILLIHYLRSPLFVVVLVSHAVDFQAVTLQ